KNKSLAGRGGRVPEGSFSCSYSYSCSCSLAQRRSKSKSKKEAPPSPQGRRAIVASGSPLNELATSSLQRRPEDGFDQLRIRPPHFPGEDDQVPRVRVEPRQRVHFQKVGDPVPQAEIEAGHLPAAPGAVGGQPRPADPFGVPGGQTGPAPLVH